MKKYFVIAHLRSNAIPVQLQADRMEFSDHSGLEIWRDATVGNKPPDPLPFYERDVLRLEVYITPDRMMREGSVA